MNEVCIIQSGYSIQDSNNFKADCTVTLIKTNDSKNILVDTSGPWNKDGVIKGLQHFGLCAGDVDIVIGTHGHSDHIGNLNLFPEAKFFVGFDICTENIYEDFNFKTNPIYKLSNDIEILATPGHTCSDISLIVRNTKHRTVVVSGDLFENDLKDESIWTSVSFDIATQRKNREKVLNIADYIIPGHGQMFQNKR